MAPSTRAARPKTINLDAAKVRVVRGPHKTDADSWYWRADLYVGGGVRKSLWNGWATREAARRKVAALLQAENVAQAADDARAARGSEVQTVQDLLEVWLASQQARVPLWEREQSEGRIALRAGRVKRVEHSRDALSPRSYSACKTSAQRLVRSGFGATLLGDVTKKSLRSYAAASDAAPGTVKLDLTKLRAAWAWGQAEGRSYTRGTPSWPDVVATPVRDKYTPTRPEIAGILAAMPEGWARDFVEVLATLGCRFGAAARLTAHPTDVNLARGTVRLAVKGHDRTIRAPRRVIEILTPYVEAAEDDAAPLFGRSPTGLRLALQRQLDRACEAAEVQRVTPHGFRRRVATEMLAANVPVAVYARVLGHSAAIAIKHYAAVQGDDELAAFAATAEVAGADNVVSLRVVGA